METIYRRRCDRRHGHADDVFFLVFGHVVHRIEGGEEINIAQLDAGETIGAISAIDGGRRSATVIANVDCGTATVTSAEFRDLLAEHGLIALNYLRRFSKIIRALDNRLTDLSLLSPDQRVYHELLRLAHPDEGVSQDWIINQLPSHREIASWANTSREAVAYVIGNLARRGIIERKHKLVRRGTPRSQSGPPRETNLCPRNRVRYNSGKTKAGADTAVLAGIVLGNASVRAAEYSA